MILKERDGRLIIWIMKSKKKDMMGHRVRQSAKPPRVVSAVSTSKEPSPGYRNIDADMLFRDGVFCGLMQGQHDDTRE